MTSSNDNHETKGETMNNFEIDEQLKAAEAREASGQVTLPRTFVVGDTVHTTGSIRGQWWRVVEVENKTGWMTPTDPYQMLRCGLLSEGDDPVSFAHFVIAPTIAECTHWDDYQANVKPVPYNWKK